MKKFVFLFPILLQYLFVIAQINTGFPIQEKSEKTVHFIFDSIGMYLNIYRGQIWVMDSSISYSSNSGVWFPETKRIVTVRNRIGEMKSEIWQLFNQYSNTWQNRFFKEIKYYAPGQINMKAMYPWILANGTWNQEPISFEEFDENGNLTELIHRDVNYEGNYFNYGYRDLENYDENNNKTELISQYWEKTKQDWENEFRTQNDFNSDNKITLIKTANWFGDYWQDLLHVEKTYDDSGMLVQSFEQAWDNINDEWVKRYLYHYSYNNSGKIAEELRRKWNAGNEDWINNSLITRDYNSNGLLIKEVRQFWNTDSSAWDNHECQMYEYTDNGKMLLDLFNKWINEEWRTEHGFEYTYDQNGNLVKYLEKEYNVPTDSLQNSNRTVFKYDENDNLLEDLYQFWDIGNEIWFNASRSQYTYDEHNNLIQDLNQYWTNDELQDVSKNNYYWSQFTFYDDLNEQAGNIFSIVPNPVKNSFKLVLSDYPEKAEISIFSLSGQLLKRLMISDHQSVDVRELKEGIYIIQIKTGTRTCHIRFVKI